MITRRSFLSKSLTTGLVTAGATLVNIASASSFMQRNSANKKPLILLTDDMASALVLGKNYQGLAGQKSIIERASIPNKALTDLRTGVTWLNSNKGACVICAVDVKYSFMMNEILKETRARVLFKGEHYAMKLDQGPVHHTITELPASAGVTNFLPKVGAWSEQLIASLELVAKRQWAAKSTHAGLVSPSLIRPATAKLSLATYVIEI